VSHGHAVNCNWSAQARSRSLHGLFVILLEAGPWHLVGSPIKRLHRLKTRPQVRRVAWAAAGDHGGTSVKRRAMPMVWCMMSFMSDQRWRAKWVRSCSR